MFAGNATEEFLIIQSEFALSQKCSMAILGNSGYGNMLYSHMCCSFPMSPRGSLPTRCVCPPHVEINQGDFNCKTGNKLLCDNKDVGGNIMIRLDDPKNMLGANYSFTKDAFRNDPDVTYHIPGHGSMDFPLHRLKENKEDFQTKLKEKISLATSEVCKYRRTPDSKFKFCS